MKRTSKAVLMSSVVLLLGGYVVARTASGKPGDKAELKKLKQKFAQLDANKNERLERAEFPGNDEQFQRADRDRDGSMSFQETFEFFIESEVEKAFVKYDTDRDGIIRRAEFDAQKNDGNFDEVDRNADDQITGVELQNALRDHMSGKRRIGGGSKGALKMPPSWATLIGKVDKDKSGTISKSELQGSPEGAFERLDKNGDGQLSELEFKAERKRMVQLIKHTRVLQQVVEIEMKALGQQLKEVRIDEAEKTMERIREQLGALFDRRGPH